MKRIYFLFIVLSVIFMISCGASNAPVEDEQKEEVAQVEEDLNDAAEEVKNAFADLKEVAEEMGATSNDGTAMHYEELQKYLPTEIDGYTAGKPKGGTITMQGMSYSSAEITFSKEGAGDIDVVLLDYNAAVSLYTAATAMWAMGFTIDTNEEKAGPLKLDNGIKGWEVYDKVNKDANIVLGIGSRFLLTIEADDQENTDFVKEVAQSMDLDDLSSIK